MGYSIKKLILFFLFIIIFPKIAITHGTIIVKGIEHNEGYIDVKIYDKKEHFLEEQKAIEFIRKKASKGDTIIPLSKIHEGLIAIVVYHDENNDKKLNTGLFWRPKEGFAFSNNYVPKGKPSFKKSIIKLDHGKPITIKLNY